MTSPYIWIFLISGIVKDSPPHGVYKNHTSRRR